MLHRLLDRVFGGEAAPGSDDAPDDTHLTDTVLSLPSVLRGPVEARLPGVLTTDHVFRKLLETARRSIKIFSPYVDNSFTGMAQAARVPIQIVTTLREAKMRSSPVLERFATTRPLGASRRQRLPTRTIPWRSNESLVPRAQLPSVTASPSTVTQPPAVCKKPDIGGCRIATA